ncbi:MAG: ABC transporter ATP-binding protein [Methanocorpusculum parvum]|nr:ABC transporter ATP-binding protein [Methanocorpusculum parvum]
MQNALEVHSLNKSFDRFALKDVSFTLPRGAVMGFIGENGAGKTTTIKAVLGLIRKDSGDISVLGGSIEDASVRAKIGVVFDDLHLHKTLRIRQAAKIFPHIFEDFDAELFAEYLNRFNLDAEKKIKDLSRGMRMKLEIAIALSHHPELLILDEPTAGLDPVVRDEVLEIFQDFMQDENHAILFSSHITSDIDKIADYLTFIHDGEILFSVTTDELLGEAGILKCSVEEAKALDAEREGLLRIRKNQFGCEILVRNKEQFRMRNPDAVIDSVTTEALMLFYARGDEV